MDKTNSCSSSLVYLCLFFIVFISSCLNIDHFSSFYFSPENIPRHIHHKTAAAEVKLLGRLEEELGRARVSIREAGLNRNFTSHQNHTFIPTGSIYRNPYTFYQSYIEMEKRFKIWVYKEGEPPIFHYGSLKDIYGIEGNIIDELEDSNNPLVTNDPDEAHTFFLPIGVSQIIHFLYQPSLDYDRGRLQNVVLDYVNVLKDKYPYWNRSNGADHFFVACHDWGPDISTANPEVYENVIRVLCNANITEGFKPSQDVTLPEIKVSTDPNHLGPPDDLNQSPDNRSILAFFAGGPHGYVRERLFEYWKEKDNDIQVHSYLPKGVDYFKTMANSKYCLCPSGYEVASPRLIESMYAGCVPVVISDGYPLPFSDVLDWTQFSVYIPVARIPEIKEVLGNITREEYLEKQKNVLKVKRHFVLHRPAQRFDLINMVIHSVWLRRLNIVFQT